MTKKRFIKLLMADGIGRNSATEYVRFITNAAHATFDYESLYRNLKKTGYVQEVHAVVPTGKSLNIATITIKKNGCNVHFSDDFKNFLDALNQKPGESDGEN